MAIWISLFRTRKIDSTARYKTLVTVDEENESIKESDDNKDYHSLSSDNPNDQKSEERSRRIAILGLAISIICFILSVALYGFMRYRAPSDSACQEKMWSWSRLSHFQIDFRFPNKIGRPPGRSSRV